MKHLPLKSLSFLLSLAAVPALAGTDWRDQIANDPRKLTLQQDMIAEGDVDGDGLDDLLVTSIVGPSGCCPRWWAIEPWEASGSPAPGWVRSPRSVRPTRQGAGSACSERVTPLA